VIRRLWCLLGLLLLVACGEDGGVPTAVPAASLPQGSNGVAGTAVTQPEVAQANPGERVALPPLAGNVLAGAGLSGEEGTAAGVVVADPFAGVPFTLNAELPTEPTEAAVLRQIQQGQIDLEKARQLANRFGFTGELYQESFPSAVSAEAGATPPTIYYAFDGPRTFSVDPWSASYQDASVAYDPANQPDFAVASQTAEQFLQARGLLDFPYTIQPGVSGDIFFVRLVEGEPEAASGRPLNQPEIVVSVSPEGQISYVTYQAMPNLENLNSYPLIPASEAWARLQTGVVANNIPYALNKTTPVLSGNVQSWQRPYPPGAMVQLYGWPNAYLPASGGGAARVQLYPFLLQGDEETINQIATAVGQQISLEGVMAEDGKSVTVNSWSVIEGLEPISLQGVIQREGEQVLLTADDGQTYQLPDVPADVADGLAAFVFAWNVEQTEGGMPVLQWERIDTAVTLAEEQLSATEANFESVTINGVELAYFVTYLYPETAEGEPLFATPTLLIQPAWKFSGSTNTGEKVEFFVQAVTGEFVQQ